MVRYDRRGRRERLCLPILLVLLAGCGGGGESDGWDLGEPVQLGINEVFTGEPDFVELINGTEDPFSITGWSLDLYDDGSLLLTYSFPVGTVVPPGGVILLLEGSGVDAPPDRLYLGQDLSWTTTFPLEVLLWDNSGLPMDYLAVNTGGETPNLPQGETFSGALGQTPGEGDIFRFGLVDRDRAWDWRVEAGPGTGGHPNPAQGGPVFITTPDLPDGYVGFPYEFQLTVLGGTPPYRWELLSGTLPPLLTLEATTGRLSGPVSSPSTEVFSLKVTDSFSPPRSGFRGYTLQYLSTPVGSPAGVVLNEIGTEKEAYVELLNPPGSGGVLDLSGWTIRMMNDPSAVLEYVIPDPTLVGEGEVLLVREGYGAPGRGLIFAEGLLFPWSTPERGACALLEPMGTGIDYLNWNGPFAPEQPPGVNWFGTVDAPGIGQALWRDGYTDTDTPVDWGVAAAGGGSPGALNPGQ